jgi:uncharacterized protein (TIGR03067 family)
MSEVAPANRERERAGVDGMNPLAHARGSPKRKRWLLALAIAVVLAGAGICYFALRERGTTDDLTRFQGEWEVTFDGMPTEPRAVRIRVEGDHWTYASPFQNTLARIVLNPAAKPKEIDLVMLGPDGQPLMYTRGEQTEVRQRGIYAFDGDSIRVGLSPYPDPRPRSFDPAEGPVWVLSRVKK